LIPSSQQQILALDYGKRYISILQVSKGIVVLLSIFFIFSKDEIETKRTDKETKERKIKQQEGGGEGIERYLYVFFFLPNVFLFNFLHCIRSF
jgi:hypothetical protein